MAQSVLGPANRRVLHYRAANYDAYALCWDCTSLLDCTHYQLVHIYPATASAGDCAPSHPNWQCPRCRVSQPSADELQDHLFMTHFAVSTFRCRLCGPQRNVNYPSFASMRQHFRSCRNVVRDGSTGSAAGEQGPARRHDANTPVGFGEEDCYLSMAVAAADLMEHDE